MKTARLIGLLFGMQVILQGLAGCEKEIIGPAGHDPGQNLKYSRDAGILAVKLTDNPAKYAALDVEIRGLEIYSSETGWIALSGEPRVIGILKLSNGATVPLTRQVPIAAGRYSQMKITFGDFNKLVLNDQKGFPDFDTKTIDLIFSGPKEVIVEINEEVRPSAYIEILLDFDAARSIIADEQKYFLKPVISVITDPRTGLIGDLDVSYGTITGALILTNGVDSSSTYTNNEGKFFIRGLKDGFYTLTIFPAIFKPDATYPPEINFTNLKITEGQILNLGHIQIETWPPD